MADLPGRVVVGKNGAYWRDYGTYYSMCPVSEDNDPVEPVAVYVRQSEIEELQATFDLRYDADMRAIKMWQEAHPGNDLTWPDHADLVVWLLERVGKMGWAEDEDKWRSENDPTYPGYSLLAALEELRKNPTEDAVLDLMDRIEGWVSPHAKL